MTVIDLGNSRINPSDASKVAEGHAQIWKRLTGQEARVFDTIQDAMTYIQEEYISATVLVGGHLYVAGVVRFLLQHES